MNEHYDDPRVIELCKALILAANEEHFKDLALGHSKFGLSNWMFRGAELMVRHNVVGFTTRSVDLGNRSDDYIDRYVEAFTGIIPEFLKPYISIKSVREDDGKYRVKIEVASNLLDDPNAVGIFINTLSDTCRSELAHIPFQASTTYQTISLLGRNLNESVVYFIGTLHESDAVTHFFQLGYTEFHPIEEEARVQRLGDASEPKFAAPGPGLSREAKSQRLQDEIKRLERFMDKHFGLQSPPAPKLKFPGVGSKLGDKPSSPS